MIKVALADQIKLLAVQSVDIAIQKFDREIFLLKNSEKISQANKELNDILEEINTLKKIRKNKYRDQKSSEFELDKVSARISLNQKRLDSSINAKDVQALEKDLLINKDKQLELEEAVLYFMEELESMDSEIAELAISAKKSESILMDLTRLCEDKIVSIEENKIIFETKRQVLVEDIDSFLMDTYERIRKNSGGVGVAEISLRRCGGCQIEINPADFDKIISSPEDKLVYCQECGRIIVRVDLNAK